MANNLQEELDEFLSEVENCLVSIEQSLNRSTCDLDGILQQTEWLLRDVLFVAFWQTVAKLLFSHELRC